MDSTTNPGGGPYNQAHTPSNLFLVRVRSSVSDGREEWCGRIQHVISGKAYNFCGLESLVDLMVAMQRPDAPGDDGERAAAG